MITGIVEASLLINYPAQPPKASAAAALAREEDVHIAGVSCIPEALSRLQVFLGQFWRLGLSFGA